MKITFKKIKFYCLLCSVAGIFNFATCKYGFKDTAPIPIEVKTFRVNYLENKAQYVNTQLSQQLTEKLKSKIISTTRLHQTNNDDAHYDISGYVSQYYVTTISITGNNASGNRLNVGFHLSFKNTLDDKKNFETDISVTKDYPGTQTLTEAEATLTPEVVKLLVDEIFNKIFSNW
ncbi:MAG: LPS assembly lipoprotein LptE [Ferruginibacter sp.]